MNAQELLGQIKRAGLPACLTEDGRLHVADVFWRGGRVQLVSVTLPADQRIVSIFLSKESQ